MIKLDKEAQVYHIFEAISGKYDMMNNLISLFLHKSWRRHLIKKLNMLKGSSVIDLCCGTGDLTLALAKEVGPYGIVYGVDFSECMLNRARGKLVLPESAQLKLLHGNIKSLPFSDSYFDYATLGFGLRNVSGPIGDTLMEIQRVLKPGGKLALLETSRPSLPLPRYIHSLYMRYFVPSLGYIFVGRFKEYRWLQESTWNFPEKDELEDIFRKGGFEDITATGFLYGVVTMYLMNKGDPLSNGKDITCNERDD